MKEQVATIVAAYVRQNSIGASELPALIQRVSQSLAGLAQQPAAAAPVAPTPAVPIRRSVTDDTITCLECGWSGQMLRRHLTVHGFGPDEYRARWNLGRDYPMTAKNYSARRTALAKATGFGMRGRPRRGSRK
jgi:predicted transcriptional regulator